MDKTIITAIGSAIVVPECMCALISMLFSERPLFIADIVVCFGIAIYFIIKLCSTKQQRK